MTPPPTTRTSSRFLSCSLLTTLGKSVLWAPFSRLMATASTSSSSAIWATLSGVAKSPEYMTSMPASRNALHRTSAPRSWPSRPSLATSTLMLLECPAIGWGI